MSLPVKFPRAPILCYVTDRKSLASKTGSDARTALIDRAGVAAAAGVHWIQIREKDLPASEIASVVRNSLAVVKQSILRSGPAPRILVNDRVDVAFTERAGGVHLGGNSLPVRDVSKWIRAQFDKPPSRDLLVGASCHSLEGALAASQDGADYIFFGPIFVTPTKAAFGTPQGLAKLKEICDSVSVPVLAIGGITVENIYSCVEAGASGIAAIRMFQDAADLPELLRHLRAAAH